MFAKSITLTNVILLENDLNFFLSKCGLQKYYIDQCYTFGKHITLFNVILLEKYNNFSHIIFTPICTHYWNANPVTLAILHWKIHTFFPRVKTIQNSASVWIVSTLGKKVWIFQCKMARVTGLLQSKTSE